MEKCILHKIGPLKSCTPSSERAMSWVWNPLSDAAHQGSSGWLLFLNLIAGCKAAKINLQHIFLHNVALNGFRQVYYLHSSPQLQILKRTFDWFNCFSLGKSQAVLVFTDLLNVATVQNRYFAASEVKQQTASGNKNSVSHLSLGDKYVAYAGFLFTLSAKLYIFLCYGLLLINLM